MSHEQGFDSLDMLGGFVEPFEYGLFFDAFDPMDGCQAHAICQQGKTFEDGFLGMMFPIEDRSLGGVDDMLARGTAIPLYSA